jgi:hypothetical protein
VRGREGVRVRVGAKFRVMVRAKFIVRVGGRVRVRVTIWFRSELQLEG